MPELYIWITIKLKCHGQTHLPDGSAIAASGRPLALVVPRSPPPLRSNRILLSKLGRSLPWSADCSSVARDRILFDVPMVIPDLEGRLMAHTHYHLRTRRTPCYAPSSPAALGLCPLGCSHYPCLRRLPLWL